MSTATGGRRGRNAQRGDGTRSSYLDPAKLPYPFCPGCGHGAILDALDAALAKLALDPHRVVLVSDIGCSGLSDQFFVTNAFHGLHGRSVTYASGIKLANPELHVIVLMGDGGCGIGGHHLINAARRNIGVTVLVFNNLNYGMTGGEHSVSTPPGAITATTPHGQLEQPMDICRTVAVNGATFVARTTTFDPALPELIAHAIRHNGFSLLDIWELCTAHYVPNNRFSKKALLETLDTLHFSTGVLHRASRPEFSRALRTLHAGELGRPALAPQLIERRYTAALESRLSLILAGAAGRRIGTAAAAFSRGAMLCGLWVTQRDDYPVTVRSGYSVSEVILSPEEILFTGIPTPDMVVALFPEGMRQVQARIRALPEHATVYVNAELLPLKTSARVVPLDFTGAAAWTKKKDFWALLALGALLRDSGIYPVEALADAAARHPTLGSESAAAVEAGAELFATGSLRRQAPESSPASTPRS